MTNKARKGDICAIERRSSSTMMHGKTTVAWDWYIGRVTSATRDGVIKTAEFYGQNEGFPVWTQLAREYDRGSWWRAYTISDEHKPTAEKLIGQEFASADQLRKTILLERE